jgi:hypothetical protein
MLIIPIAFFVSRSARGSNDSGGGGNSAAVEKTNQFEATKANDEAKKAIKRYLSASRVLQLSQLFHCFSSIMNIFFAFLHYFVSHLSAAIFLDVSEKFTAH